MEMKDPFDLTGRVALITGASSHGIGNESAKVLAEHGAKVFLTARREDKLQKAVEEIEAAGASAAYRVTDVSSEEDCKVAIEECVATFGRLDIMVLSAGISGLSVSGGLGTAFDTDNWRKVLGVNLDGVMFMIKHGWEECAKNDVGAIIPGLACRVEGRGFGCLHGHQGCHTRAHAMRREAPCPGGRAHEHAVSGLHRDRHDAPRRIG